MVDNSDNEISDVGSAKEVSKNPTKFYGAEITNYTENSGSNVGWKILYSDGKNIYLIADDYIPYESIPNSTKNGVITLNKPDTGSSSYPSSADFDDIVDDYKGSEDIIDSKLQLLNSEYFKYLKSSSKISTYGNVKSVAYMLDTKAWKNFAGEYAEYAVGGPTSEIIIKSWNEKYPNKKIEYQVADVGNDYKAEYGYTYRDAGTKDFEGWKNSISFGTDDSLYAISSSKKALKTWLASPYGMLGGATLNVIANLTGSLSHEQYSDYACNCGFRPLVCLKSNVELEEQSENKYIIK